MVAGATYYRGIVEEASEVEAGLIAESLHCAPDAPARDPAYIGGLLLVAGVGKGNDEPTPPVSPGKFVRE